MSGIADIFGGIGDIMESGSYSTAAGLAKQNARYQQLSTGIQMQAERRQAYQVIGGQKAQVAGSGLAESGTALNLLRSSTQQAGLQRGLTALQGRIDVNGWLEKAAADQGMASATMASGIGSLAGGALSLFGI